MVVPGDELEQVGPRLLAEAVQFQDRIAERFGQRRRDVSGRIRLRLGGRSGADTVEPGGAVGSAAHGPRSSVVAGAVDRRSRITDSSAGFGRLGAAEQEHRDDDGDSDVHGPPVRRIRAGGPDVTPYAIRYGLTDGC